MKGKVLVVEDDPAIVSVVRETVVEEGYEVLQAVGGASIAVALRERPDVTLLDVMMPGMNGVEVSQRLRGHPETARSPIIGMSAGANGRHTQGLRSDDYLVKPFALDELCARVAHWVAARSRT